MQKDRDDAHKKSQDNHQGNTAQAPFIRNENGK